MPRVEENLDLPPQDLAAEESVLGAVLLDAQGQALGKIGWLRVDDFYRQKNREIFAAMRVIDDRHEPVDATTLLAELKSRGVFEAVGGEAYLAYVAGRSPSGFNIAHYARLVQEKAKCRKISEAGARFASAAKEADANSKELLDRWADVEIGLRTARELSFRASKEAAKTTLADIEKRCKRAESGERIAGIPTGFQLTDEYLSGFLEENLIVLAAETGGMKTTLALLIAAHISKSYPVLFFSVEMTAEQNLMRLYSASTGIPHKAILNGALEKADIIAVTDAAAEFASRPLYWDDTPGLGLNEIGSKARQVRRIHNQSRGLIVVDYLQRVRHAAKTAYERVSAISNYLKDLARFLGWPVLALSQLNRGFNKDGGMPQLHHLRDSGTIEHDADVVLFSHRPEEMKQRQEASLIIAKNRNGEIGQIPLRTTLSTMQIMEAS